MGVQRCFEILDEVYPFGVEFCQEFHEVVYVHCSGALFSEVNAVQHLGK